MTKQMAALAKANTVQPNTRVAMQARPFDHGADQRSTVSRDQPVLRLGRAQHRLEEEADAKAEQTVLGLDGSKRGWSRIGTRPSGSAFETQALAPDVVSSIDRERGRGVPLPNPARRNMERAFGASFANVRVHTGSAADSLNGRLGAEAFTSGSDIFFESARFDPGSYEGRHTLAHELTHVLQQTSGRSAVPTDGTIVQCRGKRSGAQKHRRQKIKDRMANESLFQTAVANQDHDSIIEVGQTLFNYKQEAKYARAVYASAIAKKETDRANFFQQFTYGEPATPSDAVELADFFRVLFKRTGATKAAYYAAHCYAIAGNQRKADIWYRVVRSGKYKNISSPGKYLGVDWRSIMPKGVVQPEWIVEANQYLGRLEPGDVAKYKHVSKLENQGDVYEGKYKKEEKPVKPHEKTIAEEKFVEAQLQKYRDSATLPGVKQKIKDRFAVHGLGDPDLMTNAEMIEQAHKFTVGYARDKATREDLRLGLGGDEKIYQGDQVQPYSTDGLHSIASGAKYAIYAMDQMGRIYATGHRVSRVHHTSPLAGGDVAAAGEMVVQDGIIKAITNKSGHYRPDKDHLAQVLQETFKTLGGDLKNIRLKYFDSTGQEARWWPPAENAHGFLNDYYRKKVNDKVITLDQAFVGNVDPNAWTP
jgi:hypothetical protein